MNSFLRVIISEKKKEAEGIKLPDESLMPAYKAESLAGAVKNQADNAVITEIKFRSPSEGRIAEECDPKSIAAEYISGGCTAISVLTDERHFGGRKEFLEEVTVVARKSGIPLLRKDFIVDERQMYETKMIGADAVLLIAGILGRRTEEFCELAASLSIEPLVEVRTEEEADLALSCGAEIIGINNRNLNTMNTDLKNTREISEYIRRENDSAVIISESGYNSPDDIAAMKKYCDGFLIGTSLMKADNRREAVEGFVCV